MFSVCETFLNRRLGCSGVQKKVARPAGSGLNLIWQCGKCATKGASDARFDHKISSSGRVSPRSCSCLASRARLRSLSSVPASFSFQAVSSSRVSRICEAIASCSLLWTSGHFAQRVFQQFSHKVSLAERFRLGNRAGDHSFKERERMGHREERTSIFMQLEGFQQPRSARETALPHHRLSLRFELPVHA
jgi:hypothetical protein